MAQQKTKVTKLSIIVPVYNEAKNFPNVYKQVKKYVQTPNEMLVVYDFDEDTTVPVVKKLMKSDKNLKLVKNNLGRGPLNALKAGFAAVKSGPLLVIMADLADDPRDIDAMVELYEKGATVVAGSRYVKGGHQSGGPLVKRTLARLAGTSLHYLRGIPTHDVTNNFRLYDSVFLKDITIESRKGFSVAMEITVKAFLDNKQIAQVPTKWKDRTEGEANFQLWSWLPEYLRWYLVAFTHRKHGKINS